MNRRRMLYCSMLLLCWAQATAETRHPDPAVRDPNARIVVELRSSLVDRDPAAAEPKCAEALAMVARQASKDPEATAYLHLLFSRSLTAEVALPPGDHMVRIAASARLLSRSHEG